jgi:adenylate cyclase
VASTRRLAAIMFTDIVGYTALAQTDEAAALQLLQEEEDLARPLFAAHHGREIKSTGDGSLVEFDSALRAAQCAIDLQQHLQERNAQRGVTPVQLRVGVHLGDVEERGNDIFGDAVNLASRIQPLAPPGGICISGEVFDQVRGKIPNKLEKLEPAALKNVRFPVDVYRVVLPWAVREPTSKAAGPIRLAVLPFSNISPDPHDEYFADGLSEEMIMVLSQLHEVRVIARTSVSQYKSTTKSVSQIGAELGVDAVLDGSVRKSGEDLRIAVQLIDVDTQEQTWANSYDRKLEKVFAVQAEIAKQVAEALKVELQPAEQARLQARPPVRPDSYLAYLKGRTLMHHTDPASLESAKAQFELAISLDDRNAAAYSGLADVTIYNGWWYALVPYEEWNEAGRRLAMRALELDPNIAEAHHSLAIQLWSERDYVGMERECKLALSLNPGYAPAHFAYGGLLGDQGRADEAIAELALATAADPFNLNILWNSTYFLICYCRLDEALGMIQKFGELDPDSSAQHSLLAEYYLARCDLEQCLEEMKRAVELESEPRLKLLDQALYYSLRGEKEKARALLRADESLPVTNNSIHITIRVYAELGDIDECFRWMEKGHFVTVQPIRFSPRFEPVRRDPRFPSFMRKLNLN